MCRADLRADFVFWKCFVGTWTVWLRYDVENGGQTQHFIELWKRPEGTGGHPRECAFIKVTGFQ